MSVPLFAAASSHYNSASPHAPRLILLDEAFAGVDDDSRATSLGLLATFDFAAVGAGTPSRTLAGSAAESPWDPDLAGAMAARGLAVEEEAVADALAEDLVAGRG